jgi:hypothetical protein
MYSMSCVSDIDMIIQLVPNVQTVPSDGSYGICAPSLLKFPVPGINGYLAEWFRVKLCAKFTLHSCYRLFLR